MKITYVTGNYGKYISVKEHFAKEDVEISFLNHDCKELEVNDITEISKSKVMEAYNLVNGPCFVVDSGFYIDNYPGKPGYPGAFVKRSGIASNVDKLLEVMDGISDRRCRFVDCLTFYDGDQFYTFYGVSEGSLALNKKGHEIKKAKSNLWYVFIPNNHDKTLAEMDDDERNNRNDGHTSATVLFLEWYKKEYLGQKRKKMAIN